MYHCKREGEGCFTTEEKENHTTKEAERERFEMLTQLTLKVESWAKECKNAALKTGKDKEMDSPLEALQIC